MSRPRLLAVASLALAAAVWTAGPGRQGALAEDGPPAAAPRPAGDDVWEYQARVICDWPKLPGFEVDGKAVGGEWAVVAVLAAGEDPAEALAFAARGASAEKRAKAYWVAPDAETQARAVAAQVAGMSGAVAPQVGAALGYTSPAGIRVDIALRPAVLVVSPDGAVVQAHFPGSAWSPDHVAWALRSMLRLEAQARGEFRLPSAIVPKPRPDFQGALACAACHRNEFKDWLMTPHSAALEDLVVIRRDTDDGCIGCHVVGWQQEGGYSDRRAHRPLADVQCESCHQPSRTHAGAGRTTQAQYLATCAPCHTTNFSLFSDFGAAMRFVAHPQRAAAEFVKFDDRTRLIGKLKDQMYREACGKSEYVGSAACTPCHQEVHPQWAGTDHARAFRSLPPAGRTDPECLACHTTGHGHKGGFQSEEATPGRDHVGCESCHGPGKKHIEAQSVAERKATVFSFDEKCPTCVVQRICLSCHEPRKRPCRDDARDTPFELVPMMEKVRHRTK